MCRGEPSLEELLSDPIMAPVLRHSRISEGDLRRLIAEVSARLARSAPSLAQEVARDQAHGQNESGAA